MPHRTLVNMTPIPDSTGIAWHTGRPTLFAVTIALVMLTTPLDTLARQSGQGRVVRPHFPDMLYETQGAMDVPFARAAEQYGSLDLLPAVDSLVLDYAWDGTSGMPVIRFDLAWYRGFGGIVDGEPAGPESLPDGILLEAIDLQASVVSDGGTIGYLQVRLDGMALLPDTAAYAFETAGVGWSGLFADVDSVAAMAAFRSGFRLENLDVLRVTFVEASVEAAAGRDVPAVVHVRGRRTVYVPDPGIYVDWVILTEGHRPPVRTVRVPSKPRGGESGRAPVTREVTRGGREKKPADGAGPLDGLFGDRKKDKDDDDDTNDLLVPAIAGAAAVVAMVFIGGSVGPAGWGDAPYGLAAGRITWRGGYLVHAAVDPDVLTGGADERLRFGISGIGRPIAGPVMPMAGLGVRVEDHSGATTSAMSVEAGLAAGFGRAFFLAGVDMVTGTPRAGLIFALRNPGRRAERS